MSQGDCCPSKYGNNVKCDQKNRGIYDQGCQQHIDMNECEKPKSDKNTEDFNYQDWYSNWNVRKEKCKPRQKCTPDFKYNGVYDSTRKCCPELTNWTAVFKQPPFIDYVIIEDDEEAC